MGDYPRTTPLHISILMPVKNTAPYLRECLDSIVSQSYSHWELIAVDDHSEDESTAIVASYAAKHPQIKVFQNEGKGIIPALRTAYQHSKGIYITRMDSDDLMPDGKLENMVNALKGESDMTLVTGYVRYFSEKGVGPGFQKYEQWLNGLVDHGTHYNEIYKECVVASPCWMTTRTAFDKAGGFNSDIYPEDYDLTFRFFLHNITIKPIPTLLHLWRDHVARTSRTHVHYSVNSFLELKIHYFLQLDYDVNKELVVWGAGKKGKRIAQLLIENHIPFEWICNNPHKIGQQLYGKTWRDCNDWFQSNVAYQMIGAVSKPQDQAFIKDMITQKGDIAEYWFC